jgi:thiosulfate dehydrogenase
MNWPVTGAMTFVSFATIAYLGDDVSVANGEPAPEAVVSQAPTPASDTWTVPDVDKLPNDAWGNMVHLGRDLTVATYAHLGPEAVDPSKRYAVSNLSCQNCHLEAGTKKFGLPFKGVFADFPQYRAREAEVGTLEDRINGCMTRSLNGRPLPLDSEEMKAFVAYIKFLSTGRPIGGRTPGRGSGEMPELARAADPAAGAKVFAENCAACHGANGQGKRAGAVGDGKGYEFPPLWGPDSFNDGAGMARLISAANFIHSNMPKGTTADQPALTPEQAWDVAAYMESKKRPQKADLDKDYAVRTEKPADAGYGPYVDSFSQDQHKYGPFQPIRDKLKAIEAATTSGKALPANANPTGQ